MPRTARLGTCCLSNAPHAKQTRTQHTIQSCVDSNENCAGVNQCTTKNMAAKNMAAKNMAAKNMAAKNMAAKNMAAKNMAAKNMAAKNMAAKNMAAKNVKTTRVSFLQRYPLGVIITEKNTTPRYSCRCHCNGPHHKG